MLMCYFSSRKHLIVSFRNNLSENNLTSWTEKSYLIYNHFEKSVTAELLLAINNYKLQIVLNISINFNLCE